MSTISSLRIICSVALALSASAHPTVEVLRRASAQYTPVCDQIATRLFNTSSVFYPGQPEYEIGVKHYSLSSSQVSACVVEPATPAEVGEILNVVASTRTPFAIKGGGHTFNQGFSSTEGVHISLAKFKEVSYIPATHGGFPNAPNGVVTFGAGVIWDEVYAALDPLNVTVAGGRASGVGAAGFTLGGGYSFFTSEYGMLVDMVLAYELVTPNGIVRTVTAADKDLFWALKGGGNNFGVVTKFTVKAIPYTQIWGGLLVHAMMHREVADALLAFQEQVHDPKAVVLPTFMDLGGTLLTSTLLFYHGENPPAGYFDMFLNLPGAVTSDVKTRKMADLIALTALTPLPPLRGCFHTLTVPENTPELVNATLDEIVTNYAAGAPAGIVYISYTFEPMAKTYLTKPKRTSDSAFPPPSVRAVGGIPLQLDYGWSPLAEAVDDVNRAAIKASAEKLQALVPGPVLERYPNYVAGDATLEQLYGKDGAKKLTKVANTVDPAKVMDLAGGFRAQ
ncbi:FAD-binding domain-containing protein [Auriculariales sp. MPI-PUGE-AT-0066]|nr:FAD-binding domain-containing protein [Auriculariales sp. MPI-PUGE-AT-0066]